MVTQLHSKSLLGHMYPMNDAVFTISQDDAMMRDVILAIRADEAHHRDVNHTLSSMPPDKQNPFGPGQ